MSHNSGTRQQRDSGRVQNNTIQAKCHTIQRPLGPGSMLQQQNQTQVTNASSTNNWHCSHTHPLIADSMADYLRKFGKVAIVRIIKEDRITFDDLPRTSKYMTGAQLIALQLQLLPGPLQKPWMQIRRKILRN
mmetsp:Transcript_39637/g.84548  ORF Transcript_39637/g.84548 Transcript_39637/m.84548 type:complete len:133 (+) Transcript_39637:278-676(+)